MNPDDLLNTEAAARYLNRSPKTLEHWRSIGAGPAYHRLGSAISYRRADLDSYWLSGRVEPTTTGVGRIDREAR